MRHAGTCSSRRGPRQKRPLRSLRPRKPRVQETPTSQLELHRPEDTKPVSLPGWNLRRVRSHTLRGREKGSLGGGKVSRGASSVATPPRAGYWESAARMRLGRCVSWPGGYRGDGTGARPDARRIRPPSGLSVGTRSAQDAGAGQGALPRRRLPSLGLLTVLQLLHAAGPVP